MAKASFYKVRTVSWGVDAPAVTVFLFNLIGNQRLTELGPRGRNRGEGLRWFLTFV